MPIEKKIVTSLKEYQNISELPLVWQDLVNKAKKMTHQAYAPYSNFNVGAALLLENNEIILGSNQENAAYPSGLCAERVAFFSASANFPNVKMKVVAVSARSTEFEVNSPVAPCGSCRQVMLEYECKQEDDIIVLLTSDSGIIYQIDKVADLLPFFFSKSSLSIK
jgi:cytidine deaminase